MLSHDIIICHLILFALGNFSFFFFAPFIRNFYVWSPFARSLIPYIFYNCWIYELNIQTFQAKVQLVCLYIKEKQIEIAKRK